MTHTSLRRQSSLFTEIEMLAEEAIHDHCFPGAAVGVFSATSSDRSFFVYAGRQTYRERSPRIIDEKSIFDLASLTKSITHLLALVLYEQGLLDFEERVAETLHLCGKGTEEITVKHLVTFTVDFEIGNGKDNTFAKLTKKEIMAILRRADLRYAAGAHHEYRDPSTVLLSQYLAKKFKTSFEVLLNNVLLGPLGLENEIFFDPRKHLSEERMQSVVPTEMFNLRGRVHFGEVHDETAAIFGSEKVGCAGLFATAPAITKLFHEVLRSFTAQDGLFQKEATRKLLIEDQLHLPGHAFSMGFDKLHITPNYTDCACFNNDAILATGFTGTSVMLSPARDMGVVILTNRIYPIRPNKEDNQKIRVFRRKIAKALFDSCEKCSNL